MNSFLLIKQLNYKLTKLKCGSSCSDAS